MKNLIIATGLALVITGLVSFKSISTGTPDPVTPQQEASGFEVPANVKSILENSCLQCHGSDGNVFAKAKWNYDKMTEMSTKKLTNKLLKIGSKVEKDKMPPKKYVKKHPYYKLSNDEKETLITWAVSKSEEIKNQNVDH